jgi:DNA-directed RNA polymerase subunit RPC12/RpoP
MVENHVRPQLLDQAIAAVQMGDLVGGRRMLAHVLGEDPRNEEAWLWLGTAVDDLGQRTDCLRRVLALNPRNRVAWERLASLTSQDVTRDRPVIDRATIREFPCSKCGGDLHWDIGHKGLYCDHCGYLEVVPEVNAADNERAVFGMLDSLQGQADVGGSLAVHCERCGATTTTSARNQAVECPFCGTAIQLNIASQTPVMVPQALLPFEVDEKQARAALKKWLGRGWLRPAGLAAGASIQRVRGVYIPFFTFDDLLSASYSDEQHYVFWDDILICGSYSLTDKTARGLEPFKTKELVLYRPEFLAGWPAEVSQLSLADASIRARERMTGSMRDEFPPNAAITEVSMGLMSYKHVLLPVWVGAYSYDGHLYTFAVNGQTGKAAGAAPHSLAAVFDLLLVPLFVVPAALLVTVLEPALSGLSSKIVPVSIVVWLICALIYGLSRTLGWRDVDVSQAGTPNATAPASGRPENRSAINGLVDRLGK